MSDTKNRMARAKARNGQDKPASELADFINNSFEYSGERYLVVKRTGLTAFTSLRT